MVLKLYEKIAYSSLGPEPTVRAILRPGAELRVQRALVVCDREPAYDKLDCGNERFNIQRAIPRDHEASLSNVQQVSSAMLASAFCRS
jgi:hypothetical protein